jgi:hypothetical protein
MDLSGLFASLALLFSALTADLDAQSTPPAQIAVQPQTVMSAPTTGVEHQASQVNTSN